MKTTLDLPDALFLEAKAAAVRRRTTFKAIVEKALRRELAPAPETTNPDPEKYEVGPFGILSLKKSGKGLTVGQYQEAIAHQHDEEDARVIAMAKEKA